MNPKGFVDGKGKAILLIFVTTDAIANCQMVHVSQELKEQAPVSEDDLLILEERCLRDDREKRIISRIVKMTNLTKTKSRRKSIEKTCSQCAVGLVHVYLIYNITF